MVGEDACNEEDSEGVEAGIEIGDENTEEVEEVEEERESGVAIEEDEFDVDNDSSVFI